MPVDEWEPWPAVDEDEPEAQGPLGEDDPDEWLSEADEDTPEYWDCEVVA